MMKNPCYYCIEKYMLPVKPYVTYDLWVKHTRTQKIGYRLYAGTDLDKLIEVGNKYGLSLSYTSLVNVLDFSRTRGLNQTKVWVHV